MISLKKWYYRYGLRPLHAMALLVVLGAIGYIYQLKKDQDHSQSMAIKQISESIALALTQKNRVLIESLLETCQWQIGARSSRLLFKGEPLLASTATSNKKPLLAQIVKSEIPGFSEYQLELVLTSDFLRSGFLGALLFGILLICMCYVVLILIRRRFITDILSPLQRGMTEQSRLEIQELEDIRKSQLESERLRVESAVAKAMVERDHQISHDIRSPLAALNVLVSSTKRFPEEEHLLFRRAVDRICDIANKLSQKVILPTSESIELSIQAVAPLIESLVSEKRTQYRSKLDINIECDVAGGFGLFSLVEPNDLKTILSNLINNAVESIYPPGKVEITLLNKNPFLEIRVSDSGMGMDEVTLSLIGNRGATFNKPNGSGLGLFHAINTVKKWDGSLKIDSKPGVGTIVSVILKKATPPDWLANKITISPETELVVLDDDWSIHQVWRRRLQNLDEKIKLISFSTAEAMESWFEENPHRASVFLIDQELSDSQQKGLDLIHKLGIGKCSVLVTSHYDSKEIQAKCTSLQAKLLPKSWVTSIPLENV